MSNYEAQSQLVVNDVINLTNKVNVTITCQVKRTDDDYDLSSAVVKENPSIYITDLRYGESGIIFHDDCNLTNMNGGINEWLTVYTWTGEIDAIYDGDVPRIEIAFGGYVYEDGLLNSSTQIYNRSVKQLNVMIEPNVLELSQTNATPYNVNIHYKLDINKITDLYVLKKIDWESIKNIVDCDGNIVVEEDSDDINITTEEPTNEDITATTNDYDKTILSSKSLVQTSQNGEGDLSFNITDFQGRQRDVVFIFIYESGFIPIGEQYITQETFIDFDDKCTITNKEISCNIGGTLDLQFRNSEYNPIEMTLQAYGNSEWNTISTLTVQQQSYSWDLSTYANAMYQLCPTSNTLRIRIMNTTGETVMGYANVINSNPIVPIPIYSNQESVRTLCETEETALTLTTIPIIITCDSPNAQNYATLSKCVITIVGNNKTYVNTELTISQLLNYSYSTLDSGTYKATVIVTDSRGNQTSAFSTFVVLPYHKPVLSAYVMRENGIGENVLLDFKANISSVMYNSEIKNTVSTIQYTYQNITDGSNISPIIDINNYNTQESNFDTNVLITRNSDLPLIVGTNVVSTYEFNFYITDTFGNTTSLKCNLDSAQALLGVFENGKVLIGQIPTDTIMNGITDADLIVANDIVANNIHVVEQIQLALSNITNSLTIVQPVEPSNQLVGSLWMQEE